MNILDMTYEDFIKLNHREWDETLEFDSIVILPIKLKAYQVLLYIVKEWIASIFHLKEPEMYEIIDGMHDSNFRCMDFVAVKQNEPICLLSGCSDVIHLEGIGGYGHNWNKKYNGVPNNIPVSAWNIDCLPKSGLLRLWSGRYSMTCGYAISSFELYTTGKKR